MDTRCYTATDREFLRNPARSRIRLKTRFGTAICAGAAASPTDESAGPAERIKAPDAGIRPPPAVFDNPSGWPANRVSVPTWLPGRPDGPKYVEDFPRQAAVAAAENAAVSTFTPTPIVLETATLRR